MEKQINTRILQKHDLEENWLKAQNFVPKAGELIVYDADKTHPYPRIKIGDGEKVVNDLPFISRQANWNQNDESQPDFVQGRTHWAETEKVVLSYDGSVVPEKVQSIGEITFINLNDQYIPWQYLIGCILTIKENDNEEEKIEITEEMIESSSEEGYILGDFLLSCSSKNPDYGLFFPGTWMAYYENIEYFYLETNFYVERFNKIDSRFLETPVNKNCDEVVNFFMSGSNINNLELQLSSNTIKMKNYAEVLFIDTEKIKISCSFVPTLERSAPSSLSESGHFYLGNMGLLLNPESIGFLIHGYYSLNDGVLSLTNINTLGVQLPENALITLHYESYVPSNLKMLPNPLYIDLGENGFADLIDNSEVFDSLAANRLVYIKYKGEIMQLKDLYIDDSASTRVILTSLDNSTSYVIYVDTDGDKIIRALPPVTSQSFEIEYDFNPEGKVHFINNDQIIVKIDDEFIDIEDFKKAELTIGEETIDMSLFSFDLINEDLYDALMYNSNNEVSFSFAIGSKPFSIDTDFTLESGIWFMYYNSDYDPSTTFQFKGTKSIYEKINKNYLPTYTASEVGAVSIDEQILTEEQKLQARTNIGAVPVGKTFDVEKTITTGKNLLNINAPIPDPDDLYSGGFLQGYRFEDDGTIVQYNSTIITDYIAVIPGKAMALSTNSTGTQAAMMARRVMGYDAEKQLIGLLGSSQNGITASLIANVAYVRLQFDKKDVDAEGQVEYADVWNGRTEYEPYTELVVDGAYTLKKECLPETFGAAVLYTPQTLTPEEQAQARANIGVGGGLSISDTATIGQTIVVKSVDENGKPTEWEAKDYQQRTHGIWNSEILPETTPVYDEEVGIYACKADITLVDGNSYIVKWNGVDYVTNCVHVEGEDLLGNGAVLGLDDTGEPFCVVYDNDAKMCGVIPIDGTTEITFSIFGEMFNKIPDIYLPKQAMVCGSTNGSVRTYGTTSENDEYIMGEFSFAEGRSTTASGDYSHAEGSETAASGRYSHAEGSCTASSGSYSHAEGLSTTASGDYSHAEGSSTTASGAHSHAEGNSSRHVPDTITAASTDDEIFAVWGTSKFLLAKGYGSHAEGSNTLAIAGCSHAEGSETAALKYASHTEGDSTIASGSYSHAEGLSTIASGHASHAEGSGTTASGSNSHAEGRETLAYCSAQHVQGEYNIVDPEYDGSNQSFRGKYAHIVGNGTHNGERSNAHTLDWNGVGWYQGGLQIGGNAQDDGAKNVLVEGDAIPVPQTATVGQIMIVKAVDESGKPTEWELINLEDKIREIASAYVNEAILGGAW